MYFNPRTPVGCDRHAVGMAQRGQHFNPRTPVGCDRRDQYPISWTDDISIHAPQWGATVRSSYQSYQAHVFQSTHPSGVRPSQARQNAMLTYISIHAPQWGATRRTQASTHAPLPFQSTHPSGVRPFITASNRLSGDFNPRTPVGCDRSRTRNVMRSFVFQSTHPSGVRLGMVRW